MWETELPWDVKSWCPDVLKSMCRSPHQVVTKCLFNPPIIDTHPVTCLSTYSIWIVHHSWKSMFKKQSWRTTWRTTRWAECTVWVIYVSLEIFGMMTTMFHLHLEELKLWQETAAHKCKGLRENRRCFPRSPPSSTKLCLLVWTSN